MSFTEVLNLSISASWLVLAVAAVRLVLKKAPKAFHCALWALVAFRLLCPVSLESTLSLIPSREVIPEQYLAMEPVEQDTPAKLEIVTNPVYEESVTLDTETTVDRVQNWDLYATLVWLTGMGAMGIYAAYSYLSLRLRVRMAGWAKDNIWECDELDSPFILGILRPRIYLPSNLDEITRAHVLAHENAHLKRLDHLWKPLGFVLLTIHWFNPVMWLGYVLLCRDIELACDEKVIKHLDKPAVRAYSEALVICSVSHRSIAMCPLAFGEVGVKGRIRSMLNYKKPGFWVIVAAVVLSIAVAVCFLTDPAEERTTLARIREEDGYTITAQTETSVHVQLDKDKLPRTILNGQSYTFEPTEFIVSETETTQMYLESARMYGDELKLTFNFTHTLPSGGEILLPYRVENGGRVWTAEVSDGSVSDAVASYPDEVRMLQLGPDPAISVGIGMDLYRNAQDHIAFDLSGMNLLRYAGEDHIPARLSDFSLEGILSGDGYDITADQEQTLHVMFYKQWLPEEIFSDSGYSFADGELVLYEGSNSRLSMVWAGPDGDSMRFDFTFDSHLTESGTLLLPYRVSGGEIEQTLALAEGTVHDYRRSYGEGVSLMKGWEAEDFSILVDRELYENADDYLAFELGGLHALTYVPAGLGLTGRNLVVAEHLYRDPEHTITGTAYDADRYAVTGSLTLTACTDGGLWPIDRNLGELKADRIWGYDIVNLFNPSHWTAEDISSQLRNDNLRTWLCEGDEHSYLLVQQKDGALYLVVLDPEYSVICDLYRLADRGEAAGDVSVTTRSYVMDGTDSFDAPNFYLYSDGTFLLIESMLSSYHGYGSYTLSQEELVLHTDDGLYDWYFTAADEGFAFDAERSSPITYVYDARTAAQVQDGQLFRLEVQQTQEPPTLEDSIAEAIVGACWSGNEGRICAESHRILAEAVADGVDQNGNPIGVHVLYLYAAYGEYEQVGYAVRKLESTVFPAVLTFEIVDGVYTLTEYVSGEEAKARFPDFAREQLERDRETYAYELDIECTGKATATIAEALNLDAELSGLLDIISYSPAEASNPGAYITVHAEEYERFKSYGEHTLRWCFAKFAEGGLTDLRGHIMAIACQELITESGEECRIGGAFTGQAWFNQFAAHAEELLAELGREELRESHPACAMVLDSLGI